MDKYNHLNRPVSNKEYKSLTKDLIKHENRKNIGNIATTAGGVGIAGYLAFGKSYTDKLKDKVKASEKAISMKRTELHKPLKDVINIYRQERNYPKGRGKVIEVQHTNPKLKALPGPKGKPFVGSAYTIHDKNRKPIDFPAFIKGVKNVRKEIETKKLKPMKIQLSSIKDQTRGIPHILAAAQDEATKRVARRFFLPLSIAGLGITGHHAYKYNQAAKKKLNESDTSVWRGGKYYYKDKEGSTYKVKQHNPAIQGGLGGGAVAGYGYGTKALLKKLAKKEPAYGPHLEPIMKHLTHKKIGAVAAGVGALGTGTTLLRNKMDKKYMPAYLKGTTNITKVEYKKNKEFPMPMETPGNPIFTKSHKKLFMIDSDPEDKYPWSSHQILNKGKKK